MGRFDERDEDLNRQSKPIKDTVFALAIGIGIGFLIGSLWGLWFFGAQIEAIEVGVQGIDTYYQFIPGSGGDKLVFQHAEAILSSNTQHHIKLFDGITLSDQTFINGQIP